MNIQPRNKLFKWILGGVVLFLLVGWLTAPSSMKYTRKFYKRDKEIRDSIQKAKDERILSLETALDSVMQADDQDEIVQYNYYDDYLRERRKNKKYESIIKNIVLRDYDYEYLRKLADTIRFY